MCRLILVFFVFVGIHEGKKISFREKRNNSFFFLEANFHSKNNLHFKYKKSHEDDRKNIYGI